MPKVIERKDRSASVPGPSHHIDDAVLKARLATKNQTPFSAEHSAAYAAFAGITSRATALMLHSENVGWDAVNDYTATDLVGATQYTTMVALMQAGVTPADLSKWDRLIAPHSLGTRVSEVLIYAQANLSPADVARHVKARTPGRGAPIPWDAAAITVFVKAGLSPARIGEWEAAGVIKADHVSTLERLGCTPALAEAYMARVHRNTREVVRRFTVLLAATSQCQTLARAAFQVNATLDEVSAWRKTGLPTEQAARFVSAQVSAHEWVSDPTIRAADDATLDMLAALSPHPRVA